MNQFDDQHTESPEMMSLMGYSLVREAGQLNQGISLCLRALALNPQNCDLYLNLGRVYVIANKYDLAIKAFRKGLKIRKDARIMEELRMLGIRRSPPFASLPRDNVANKVTGKILHALKLG